MIDLFPYFSHESGKSERERTRDFTLFQREKKKSMSEFQWTVPGRGLKIL
jgi:hypothetical protein